MPIYVQAQIHINTILFVSLIIMCMTTFKTFVIEFYLIKLAWNFLDSWPSAIRSIQAYFGHT